MRWSVCVALVFGLPTIPQITETLEKVQKGLGHLHDIDGLDALQASIESTLMTLKADSKTDDEKRMAAQHVQKEILGFKEVLSARQAELQAQTESAGKLQSLAKTDDAAVAANALFADLVAVQDAPMEAQMKVLKSEQYAKLPAAAAVLKMVAGTKTEADEESLASLVGKFLDGHLEEGAVKSPAAKATDQLSAIEGSLMARSKRLQTEVRSMDQAEKARESQTHQGLGLKADAESDGIAKAAKALKFFDKAAHRTFLKSRATKVSEEASLDKAVDAIKHHDIKTVTKILASLKQLDAHPIV